MKKGRKYFVLSAALAWVTSTLLLFDLTRVPRPGSTPDAWHFVDPWAFRWPPFVGHQSIMIPQGVPRVCAQLFLLSAVALVASALWLAASALKGKLIASRSATG